MSKNQVIVERKFLINKRKLLTKTLFTILFFLGAIAFILKPEWFLLNVFVKPHHILILGIFSSVYFAVLLFSYFHLLMRKNLLALAINNDFILDNSRYESLGKIYWSEISGIKKINKGCIEISLVDMGSKHKKMPVLKRFLLFMSNWNYKRSIVVHNNWIDFSAEDLEKSLNTAFKQYSTPESQ